MFSGTVRARDRLRFGPAGAGAGAERRTGKVTAISVFDRGPATAREQVVAGQIGKLCGLGGIQIGDSLGAGTTRHRPRLGSGPAAGGAHVLRAADAGNRGRARPAGRQGCAARRARPARRAGSADQRAAGRHPPGDPRLALRRGAERSHPGHAGRGVRPRGRVPRVDHAVHRAAVRPRRGRRVHERRRQPVPGHSRAADRAGRGRLRGAVPAGHRARARCRSRSRRRSRRRCGTRCARGCPAGR